VPIAPLRELAQRGDGLVADSCVQAPEVRVVQRGAACQRTRWWNVGVDAEL